MTATRIAIASSFLPFLIGCGTSLDVEEDTVQSATSELANGTTDRLGRFPQVVEVSVPRVGSCTGTVIGCRQILTAAHCFCEPHPSGAKTTVTDATTCALSATVSFARRSGGASEELKGMAAVHPSYQMVKNNKGIISNRSDLAIVSLRKPVPQWMPRPVRLAPDPAKGGDAITLVGYGARNASTYLGVPSGQCLAFKNDHVRRWGTSVIGTAPSNFPGFFYMHKSGDDPDSSLILPGDSGGPALRDNELLGVASMDTCKAQWPLALQSTISGYGWYMGLDVVDEGIQETHSRWISKQVTDCTGEPNCSDRLRNGDEIGIDCGGNNCPACSPVETCNFVDDDHDGQVDEGHDWQIGHWNTVFTGSFVRHFRAIRLSDGRMAVAGYDDTRFYAVILSPAGTVAAGPFIGDLAAPNVSEIDLTENPLAHELAVVAGTNNYACAATGCPIRMMRVDLNSGTHSVGTLPVPYAPQNGARITLSGDNTYVIAGGSRAPAGVHLSWFDSTLSRPVRNVELSNVVASMNISGGSLGLAWCEGLAPTLHCGVMTSDGADVMLAAQPVPDDGATVAHNGTTGENGMLWSGNDLVIAYTRSGPPAQGRIFRMAIDGSTAAGPVDVDGAGFPVSGISEYRGNFLVRTTSPDGTHHVHRLDQALKPVSSPGGPLVVQGYGYLSVVDSGEGLFVVGARPDRLDIARLGCE